MWLAIRLSLTFFLCVTGLITKKRSSSSTLAVFPRPSPILYSRFCLSRSRVTHKRRKPDETVRERWPRASTFFVLDVSLTFLFFRRRSTSSEPQLFGIPEAGRLIHFRMRSATRIRIDSMEGARHVFHRARRATVERETERFRGRRSTFFFKSIRRSCLRERFPNQFAGHADTIVRMRALFLPLKGKRDRNNSYSRRRPLIPSNNSHPKGTTSSKLLSIKSVV